MKAPLSFLPAKKLREEHNLTLAQHLVDTEQAAVALFGPGRRWGRAFARFFKLGGDRAEAFLLNLRVAGLFHDIGKANADFLAAMGGAGFERQTLRHEHISALVLHLPEIRGWLAQNDALDLEAITGAVLSHHLKAEGKRGLDYRWGNPATERSSITLYLQHQEIMTTLARVASLAALPPPPSLPEAPLAFREGSMTDPWASALREGFRCAELYGRAVKDDQARHAMLLAAKAGLIAADSVASAMFRTGTSIDEWVSNAMGEALTHDLLQEAIIGPRLNSIHPGATLRDFQREVAQQGPRALLIAACGAGKTLAAWAWAQAQLERCELGRVVFLYPTRGTATEGFRDYVGWAPEGEGALLHGTAAYELVDMAQNPPEPLKNKRLYDEASERLFSLGHWPQRYFSATADQFLSFMENTYTGLCMVPLMADAALVVDEVHSYDEGMFRSLLAFLRHFDGPVLCMTATLPPDRRRALADVGVHIFPDDDRPGELAELRAAEQAPRYRARSVNGAGSAEVRAVGAFHEGLRVLYVVNTVQRCQEAADRLEQRLGLPVLSYHSRFRMMDRREAHKATVGAFQQRTSPALAVTTQVCEMSLDLDADVLITEHAPVTSLVQRFGRAHRKLVPGREAAELLTYPPPKEAPYERDDLRAAARFLEAIRDRHISQAELAATMLAHVGDRPEPDVYAAFVNSGYFAVPGSFREIDQVTDTAVLDGDVPAVLALHAQHKAWDGYVLPVPRRPELLRAGPSSLPRYLKVAPASAYSVTRGFVLEKTS